MEMDEYCSRIGKKKENYKKGLCVIVYWLQNLGLGELPEKQANTHFVIATSGKTSQQDKALNKPVLWSCSICTYDNDQSYLSCEICGVLRDPSVASGKASDAKGTSF